MKNAKLFGKSYVRTLSMTPNSVSVYAYQSKYFVNFRREKLAGLGNQYQRKCVRKPILANLGTRIFKRFSPVQAIVVPPRETNISKLLTALLMFIRAPL